MVLDFVRLAASQIEGRKFFWPSRGGDFWWRSRRARGRTLPDFDFPFCAGGMLMRPRRGIDGRFLVGRRSQIRECSNAASHTPSLEKTVKMP